MNKPIELRPELEVGAEREVQTLLVDRWRRLVLIQIRRGAVLAEHSARVPITIQTIAGSGRLRVEGLEYALTPGVVVPVDAHAIHSVCGDPSIAILVTFFRQAEAIDDDSTARSDG
jgi:quercetin dioxygenase-like cupin family protein